MRVCRALGDRPVPDLGRSGLAGLGSLSRWSSWWCCLVVLLPSLIGRHQIAKGDRYRRPSMEGRGRRDVNGGSQVWVPVTAPTQRWGVNGYHFNLCLSLLLSAPMTGTDLPELWREWESAACMRRVRVLGVVQHPHPTSSEFSIFCPDHPL